MATPAPIKPITHKPILSRLFRETVAIDLGTSNTVIHTDTGGVVLDEPSVVCFERGAPHGAKPIGKGAAKRIVAVGDEARRLLGREPGHLYAVQPIRHGVIADVSAAEYMTRRFIGMALSQSLFSRRSDFTVCVPASATQVERRAIREAVLAAGASRVSLIGASLAAALGAGLPVRSPTGSMVVDIGGGTTEVGVIALGGAVYDSAIRVGGEQLDDAIIAHVRNLYGVQLGEQTAGQIKMAIGSAIADVPLACVSAVGRSVADGLPRTVEVSNLHIADAIDPTLRAIIVAIKRALEAAPAELITDIASSGIVLTGGGALLGHLATRIEREVGLAVRIADDPQLCAAHGAGEAAQTGFYDEFAYA